MKPTAKKIFDFLYGPFFAVLDFFMRHYKANRERLDNFMSKAKGIVFSSGFGGTHTGHLDCYFLFRARR